MVAKLVACWDIGLVFSCMDAFWSSGVYTVMSDQSGRPLRRIGQKWKRKHFLSLSMFITDQSYHLSKFQTHFETFHRKILYNQIAPRWRCRRLCVGWTQRFQNVLMYLYQSVDMQYFQNFFSGILLSTALQVVVQYEKTPCRLWYWLWCFNMGALHCFLQRAHGVLVADCNICWPCWFSIRLIFSTSHIRCPRISAF